DGNSILTMSPENYYTDGTYPKNNAVFGIIDFEEETCNTKFKEDDFRLVDLGLDYYAPQSFTDKEGRRVQIGWLRMNKPFENHKWVGIMSLPRVVEVKNKQITTDVHPNISSLFTREVDMEDIDLKNPICIKATLKDNSKINIGGYEIAFENNIITVDRTKVFNQKYVNLKASTQLLKDEFYIEVYIDYGVIETYINKGQYVISHIVNPLENKLQISNLSDFKVYTIE
ncbi:MAG: GH32 C-terminal domain-containing protein, partial [Intestinibacter sp.]|uniref:GH32 C-terminal domain-containing protein n=1 Tax=Intestinibacter sp. TaxID=1965304 RepID=UPI003F15B37B